MPALADDVRFNRDVRPILADNCLACHGADEAAVEAGLRLDDPESAFAERDGVRAIVPGDPDASDLVRRIHAADPEQVMPPPRHPVQLTEKDKGLLVRWIEQGAEYEGHWAFQTVERPKAPGGGEGPAAVDAFIEKRRAEAGLDGNPPASRETLLRRLSLDLTGLPPSVEEVDAFVRDKRPDAYERQVDRLLASAHYGERMAMWWLDGARYADSHGFQADWERYQWPWRDWVIRAFNTNQPFDEFTIEQIAGDMLPGATEDQVVATGFCRNHRINTEGGALDEEWLVENVMDRVDTVGSVWLGLTLSCARCHDHKYDPLTQREFYEFFAFFHNVPEQGKGPGRQGNFEPVLKLASPEQEAELARLAKEIEGSEKELLPWLPKNLHGLAKTAFGERGGNADAGLKKQIQGLKQPEAQKLKKRNLELRKKHEQVEKQFASVMVMREMEAPRKTFILDRGEYQNRTEEVQADLPAFLPPLPQGEAMNRLGLARWLVSREQPLTARVQVNRLWELVFGTGLVKSSENLGVQADWPSHPELLDWLGAEFMESGWDVKAMLKTMVMTDAYRQDVTVDSVKLEKDPDNRFLSRGPRFRVQAEIVRDQALAISGLLNPKLGGPSVRPYQPEGIWSETNFYGNLRNYKHDTDGGQYRRSLYTIWKRTAAPPGMTLFDMPSREVCVVRRSRSNTPLQALALMNDVTYLEASRRFAERMMEHGDTPEVRLAWGWKCATARQPDPEEVKVLVSGFERRLEFYRQNPEEANALLQTGEAPVSDGHDPAELAAMATAASVILNLDEVITKG
ncbi:chromosome segregation protein [Haloferula helveola]|uniref:Chromosome segregation protein n=1 Tax=Haloferula helveola TaxID=490095 RepID=A0ABN6H3B0_9BACT|nr:chromosome segregation protein [Haloferula helveola]